MEKMPRSSSNTIQPEPLTLKATNGTQTNDSSLINRYHDPKHHYVCLVIERAGFGKSTIAKYLATAPGFP